MLAAAAMHAGWNAVLKTGLDRLLSLTLINGFAGVVSLAAIPFIPIPQASAWPWLLGSATVHTAYKLALVRAYRAGDMGQVYPLARGAAPLLVTAVSLMVVGEHVSGIAVAGIVVLAGGIMAMSFGGHRSGARLDGGTVFYALVTSVCIAGYTLLDGIGARMAGTASAYVLYLFAIDAAFMAVACFWVRGLDAVPALAREWKTGLAGGAMSLGAYWIVIWAMTVAPIPMIAALRETSVVFALVIATVALREPVILKRVSAATIILAGIILIRS